MFIVIVTLKWLLIKGWERVPRGRGEDSLRALESKLKKNNRERIEASLVISEENDACEKNKGLYLQGRGRSISTLRL